MVVVKEESSKAGPAGPAGPVLLVRPSLTASGNDRDHQLLSLWKIVRKLKDLEVAAQ